MGRYLIGTKWDYWHTDNWYAAVRIYEASQKPDDSIRVIDNKTERDLTEMAKVCVPLLEN